MEKSWHPCWRSFDHRCEDLFLDSKFHLIGLYVCIYASTSLFDYFIVSFDIRKCETSDFVLFKDHFGYSGSFEIPYEFLLFISFCFLVLSLLRHKNDHQIKRISILSFLQKYITYIYFFILLVLELLDHKERQYCVMETILE